MNTEHINREDNERAVRFNKLSVLLPIVFGMLSCAGLFILGYMQDAPGMSAIGLALAFGLVMLGVRNAGVIKKSVFTPLMLFCYAAGIILLDLVLYFDHEFEDKPWLVFIGLALGVIMIVAGVILLRLRKSK
jgi:hypothetical protein